MVDVYGINVGKYTIVPWILWEQSSYVFLFFGGGGKEERGGMLLWILGHLDDGK